MDSLKALNAFSFKGSILAVANSQKYIYVIDNFLIFYLIDKEEQRIKQKISLKKLDEQVHLSDKSISISNGGLIAFSLPNTAKIPIVSILKKFKVLQKLENHEANKIQVTKFSSNNEFLITSGADGRVFFYNSHLDVVANMVPQPDYTSSISFSHDSKYCNISFFHKKSVLWNTEILKQKKVITTNDVVESSAFYKEYVLLAVRDGSVVKVNINEANDTSKVQLPSWPICIETFPNLEIAIVGCKDSFLYFINADSMSQVSKIKFDSPISHLQFENEYLYVYMQSGDMLLFDTEHRLEDIQIALAAKNYVGAKSCFDANPFLYLRNELVEQFNAAWEDELQKALVMLKNNKLEEAMEIAKPFLDDQKRKEQFEVYLNLRDEISRFLEAVKNNEFKKAYDLANKFAFIRKTKVYEQLELQWNKYFNAAKKLLQDSSNNVQKAEAILKPFSLVESKRAIINEMLKNYELFTIADKKIKAKDFVGYFELCRKHSFLKGTLIYQKTMEYAKIIQERVNTMMQNGEYDKAFEGAVLLANFDGYEDSATGIQDRVEVMKNFLEYTAADDIEAASRLVDSNYFLETTKEFQDIVKKFNNLYDSLYDVAKNGKTAEVKFQLDLYLEVKYFEKRVASLFRLSYFAELGSMLHDNELWLEGVKKYIQYFGYDTKLEALFEQRSISKSDIVELKELEFKFKPVEYSDSIYANDGHL
jgi:hypothetical protein